MVCRYTPFHFGQSYALSQSRVRRPTTLSPLQMASDFGRCIRDDFENCHGSRLVLSGYIWSQSLVAAFRSRAGNVVVTAVHCRKSAVLNCCSLQDLTMCQLTFASRILLRFILFSLMPSPPSGPCGYSAAWLCRQYSIINLYSWRQVNKH